MTSGTSNASANATYIASYAVKLCRSLHAQIDGVGGTLRVHLVAPLEPTDRMEDFRIDEIGSAWLPRRVEDVLLRQVGERETQEKAHHG